VHVFPGESGLRGTGTIKVYFCGTGDAFGSGGRLQSCILVHAPDARFLIDCGTSALTGIKRSGLETSDIEAICISHLHGDHYGGLPFLIKEAQVTGGREKPLIVAGPPGLEEHVLHLMTLFFPGPEDQKLGFWPDFHILAHGIPAEIDGILVTAHPAAHSLMTNPLSLRLECCGRVIAYSGDTEWNEFLPLISKNADLFVCETFQSERITGHHLDYLTLLSHRHELDCRRIVLTHLGDTMFDKCPLLEFECAHDGMLVEL
jgi:ribonuclease BN (tRNA processing enzyme)